MMDSIEAIIVRADLTGNLSEASQAATRDLAALEAAAAKARQGTTATGEAAERTSQSFGRLEAALDGNVRVTNAKAAADARLARETALINANVEAGLAGQARANALIEEATRRRDAYIAKVRQDVAASEARTAALLRETAATQRFAAVNDNAAASSGRMGQVLGQAGFQVQDFATQVSMGQNALMAFGVQGAQLAGIFGPAGAIAGAGLMIGVIAAQLLGMGESAAQAEAKIKTAFDGIKAESEGVRDLIKEIGDLFKTAAERAADLARAQRGVLANNADLRLSNAVQLQDAAATRIPTLEREIATLERRAQVEAELARRAGRGGLTPVDQTTDLTSQLFRARHELAGMRAEMDLQSRRIGELNAARTALGRAGSDQGNGQFGPAAPAPFEETRRALDREYNLRRDHASRLASIDVALADGSTTATEADRLRRLANDQLAESLRERGRATSGVVATDQELAEVGRAVADMHRDLDALMREGETLTASVRTEAEKYADTLANLNNLLAAGAISQDTYNRAVAAADPAMRAAQEASRRIEQDNTRTTDRITSFFGDAFARAFEGTGNGFKGLMESFKRAAISTFATIAAQAIIRPIVAPIVQASGLGSLGGAGGSGGFNLGSVFGGQAQAATPGAQGGGLSDAGSSFGTLRQAYNGLTSPGGLGPMFPGGVGFNTGFGAADGVLNASLIAPSGIDAATNSALGAMGGQFGPATPGALMGAGATPGLTIGSALGPAASIAGGAYGVYSGLQRGGIGGYTSAAGGAVSAITGMAMLGSAANLLPALGMLGPIGLGIGAVLAIAGSLMPGAKPSGMGQLARTNLNTGMQTTEGLGGRRYSAANAEAAGSTVDGIVRLAREVGDKLGGARIGGDVAVGVTNGDIYLDINGQKARASNTEQGAKDIAAAAVTMVLNEFRGQGTVQGDYRGIVAASGDSLERLDANLQWYEEVYKAFNGTAEVADKATLALKAVEAKFNPLIDKAHELGLSSDRLVEARQKEAEATAKAIAEARDAALSGADINLTQRAIAAGLGGGDIYGQAMALAERQATIAAKNELEQFREAMKEAGATTEEVTALIERLTAVQGAEAKQRREMSDLQRAEGLQGITNTLLQRAGAAGFGIDKAALEESQAALANAQALRELQAAMRGFGASAEYIAELSGVLTRTFDAEAEARAKLRAGVAIDTNNTLTAAEARQKREDDFRTAQSEYVSALDQEISKREQVTAAARANVEAMRQAADGLRDFTRGLRVGDGSPLTPEQQLNESRTQYARLMGLAQSGTPEERARAAQQLQGIAGTRLGLASSYYAPGTAGYVSEFEGVTKGIEALADQFGMSASVEELSLKAQQSSLDVLRQQRDQAAQTGAAVLKSLDELRAAFLAAAAAAAKSVPPIGGGGGASGPLGNPGSGNNSAYSHPGGVNINPGDSALVQAAKLVYQSTQGGVSTTQFNNAAAAVGGDIYGAVGWNGDPSALRAKFGFATGGSFEVAGPAGNDNLSLPGLRLTAGEIVNVSRGDNMAALLAEVKALRAQVAAQTTVVAQGSMAVKHEVAAQTEMLVDATTPRAPVPV